ncbi:MAG: twin-arginine translocase subunit TatC [Candidatus Bathyarchaeia archaeon]
MLRKEKYMTFWEHTQELIQRLKIVFYTLIISTVAVMILPANLSFINDPFNSYEPLIAAILRMVRERALPPGVKLIGLEFISPIELYLVSSFVLGLIITLPVFAYEILKFIDPALYPHERRTLYSFLAYFTVLFISGLFFGYYLLVPLGFAALIPFFQMVGAELYISVTDFYYFVFFLTIMCGLAFTLPAFLVLLVKYRIIGTDMLTRGRRYLYILLLVAVFAITPGEGGLANLLLFSILSVLFELGILIAKRSEGKKEEITPLLPFMERKCKFCNKNIPADAVFCPNCKKSQK